MIPTDPVRAPAEAPTVPASPPRLLVRVRLAARVRHYSRRTEDAYAAWIRRYVLFHGKRHPSQLGAREVGAFLSWLATGEQVSASTQNQALSALLFVYRVVLDIDLGPLPSVVRARTPDRLPVVLSRDEVVRVLSCLAGTAWLVAMLLYGAGVLLPLATAHDELLSRPSNSGSRSLSGG